MVIYNCSEGRNKQKNGKDTHDKPEREYIMKKSSYEAIYTALTAINYDNTEVMEDLMKEINRGAEAKARKANEYEQAKAIVLGTIQMAGKPVTVAEIFESCENELPDGFTKNKVGYGLTHYWTDEVIKTEGKVNSYSLRA